MKARLETVCQRIYAGGDVPKGRYSLTKTDRYYVPIYANAEKDDGLYGYTDEARELDSCVTVAARGTIGFAAIRTEPFLPVVRLITVVPNHDLLSLKYLFYALKSYKPSSSGTSIPQLTVPEIKRYEICVRSIKEQDYITDSLDRIDRIIALRKKELSYLDDLIKVRFVEMFGDVIHNEKGWPQHSFSDIATSRLGKMLDAKQQTGRFKYPYLANFNVQWFRFELDDLHEMDFSEADQIEFELKAGDLLVCEGGEIGRCAIWHNEVQPCYFQKALHRVRCKKEIILPEYLARWFQFNCEHGGFSSIEGAKATISHLPGAKLKILNVPIPPIELQEGFASFVAQVDKSKVVVQKSLDEAQVLFDSLMQKYFD